MLKEMTTDELMMIDGGHWTYAESQGKNNFSEREGRVLGLTLCGTVAGSSGGALGMLLGAIGGHAAGWIGTAPN